MVADVAPRGGGDANGVNQIVTMHCVEPVVTYTFPEFKDVRRRKGKVVVRFEVVWVQKKGCMIEKEVIHTVDTPAIELWYKAKGEQA